MGATRHGDYCQSARKKDPLSASKRDPFAEQRDSMTDAAFVLVAA